MANKKVQQLTAVENEQNDKSKINWKVRIKNKAFWLALIPAVLLLIQVIASVFGYTLDLGDLGNKLLYGSFYSWYRGRPNYRRCRG